VIRYPAVAGLTNQLYEHLTALAIARSLAASGLPVEVVLPGGRKRATFAKGSGFSPTPLATLLDVARMRDYWRPRGISLTQHAVGITCHRLPSSDRMHVETLGVIFPSKAPGSVALSVNPVGASTCL
jgi:hypothetical protein